MKNMIFILPLFISVAAFSQSAWNEKYYDSVTVNNFRKFAPFSQQIDINNFDHRLADAAVYYATNEIRNNKKLPVLTYHKSLEIAAYMHSNDMAEKRYFDHINNKNKKRRTPEERTKLAGISNPYPAENITEGFVLDYIANKPVYPKGKGKFSYSVDGGLIQPLTYLQLADNLLNAWMNSKGHRENILSKNNRELGCGVALYIDEKFNDMPMVKATQVFQQYVDIEEGNRTDKPF